MTFEESYQKYLVLAEANGTTDKLSTNKARYAVKYNIAQNKIIEWLIENNGSDDNRYLQSIKVPYKPLQQNSVKEDYTSFTIPKDYFDFLGLRVKASQENCKKQKIKVKEVRNENLGNILFDVNREPSFKFRETVFTIEDSSVQVYKKNFDIDSTEMSYYKYPVQVSLENPDNPESGFTQQQHEFDDKLINRIILMTVSLHKLSGEDPSYQAFKAETIQKF